MKSFPGRLKAVLAVAVLALLMGGVLFYRIQERRVRQDVESDLQAIAELKANQFPGDGLRLEFYREGTKP
jgi:hypothetical protein